MNTATGFNARQFQQHDHDIVYGLAESANALFAAHTSGLYRSQDGGITWQEIAASLNTDQAVPATAVAAQGSAVLAGLAGVILYSKDDGENWQFVQLPSPPPQIVALAFSPVYTEDGFAAAGTSEDGVFVSTDLGMHWTAWNFGLTDHNVYALAFSPNFGADRTLFAGTESGLFRSRNGGLGWQELPFPMEAAPILSLAVFPHSAADWLMFAGTEKNGLLLSSDFGANWQQIDSDLISSAVNAIHIRSTTHSSPVISLLLGDKLVYSPDEGLSWKPHRSQIPPDKMATTMLPLAASPDELLVGFADGEILSL
jgi:photosystem II stability/assembly factor-like uncharacterized protein